MGKLTAAKLKSFSKPGRYGDGDGLYFRIAPGGSQGWIQRITVNNKRRDIGLGPYPEVSLAQARRKAADNRSAVADGRDPLAEKRKAKTPTFREATETVFELNRPRWRNEKHVKNWIQSMEKYALPRLGDLQVDEIDREAVLSVLTPIWTSRPERARRLRQRIRLVLSWAQAHGIVEHNFAGDAISAALPSMPEGQTHFRALPYSEVPEALEIIGASRASMAAKLAIRFLILTACRSGEVRNAEWSEIDLEGRTWTIPASRMKGGKEHRQPLSDAALDVLERAQTLRIGSNLVFPSPLKRDRPLSDMTLMKVLRDTGLAERCTVHGFRSSFRDWASECTNADLCRRIGITEQTFYSVAPRVWRPEVWTRRSV